MKMGKIASKIKLTYGDYRNAPESERERYELYEGELVMVPSPKEPHQRISRNLEFLLYAFVKQHDLGSVYDAPFDVILDEHTVLQPDILFVSKDRSEIIVQEGIRGAPDLVIEILSEATAKRDRTYKKTLYARYGVREYWLVDLEAETIEVLVLKESGYEPAGKYARGGKVPFTPSLLKGLSIDLDAVFT
jgi:Uma2 family endonuclease